VRISFDYLKPGDDRATIRAGTLLGLTTKHGNLLLIVREDGQATIKNFLSSRASSIQTVLEEHEQVPGILSPPAARLDADTRTQIADLEAQLEWYRSMVAALVRGPR
jgi:hypothetical protein